MRKLIYLWRKFESSWESVSLRVPMNTSSMRLFQFGSNSRRKQTKLLEEDATLTLDTALDIAKTEEVTSNQIKGIANDNCTRIDALKRGQAPSHAANPPSKPRGLIIRWCGCCGSEHDISQRSLSLAFKSICGECGKENHWRKVCCSLKPNRKQKNCKGRLQAFQVL